MSAAAWPVQKAVYARLSGDATLAGLVSGVFDEPPEDAAMPYVVVGEAVETPDDAHDRRGAEVAATVHVWSRYRGFAEALAILDAVDRLLDVPGGAARLAVDGWTKAFCRRESYQTLRDPEPGVRHVPATYRITLEEQ